MFWKGQVKGSDLKMTEMLWKQAAHVRKSTNIQELKLFCTEEWAKICPSQ